MLIGRNNNSRSCANKLEGGWEREKVQRAAKRYDSDGHSKYIGLRLLLLAAVVMATKALPQQKSSRQMTKKLLLIVYVRGEILAALRRVNPDGYGAPWCFEPISTQSSGWGVGGVGSFRSFSAYLDPTMEISSCTPWQYCRTYGLGFPTSSTIAGVRGAAGERQLAVTPLYIHLIALRPILMQLDSVEKVPFSMFA